MTDKQVLARIAQLLELYARYIADANLSPAIDIHDEIDRWLRMLSTKKKVGTCKCNCMGEVDGVHLVGCPFYSL